MKRLTPTRRGGIECPTERSRAQWRKEKGASHGPYWHRSAQEGKSDLSPSRGRRGDRAPDQVLLESSTESEWVARCLETLGHHVVVADPNFAPMYATRTRKVKTDR